MKERKEREEKLKISTQGSHTGTGGKFFPKEHTSNLPELWKGQEKTNLTAKEFASRKAKENLYKISLGCVRNALRAAGGMLPQPRSCPAPGDDSAIPRLPGSSQPQSGAAPWAELRAGLRGTPCSGHLQSVEQHWGSSFVTPSCPNEIWNAQVCYEPPAFSLFVPK